MWVTLNSFWESRGWNYTDLRDILANLSNQEIWPGEEGTNLIVCLCTRVTHTPFLPRHVRDGSALLLDVLQRAHLTDGVRGVVSFNHGCLRPRVPLTDADADYCSSLCVDDVHITLVRGRGSAAFSSIDRRLAFPSFASPAVVARGTSVVFPLRVV